MPPFSSPRVGLLNSPRAILRAGLCILAILGSPVCAAAFPACTSAEARGDLVAGMAASTIGHLTGLAPARFDTFETLRSSPTELHCHVEAVLNNGVDVRIGFTFFYDNFGRQLMLFRVFPGSNSGPVYGRFSNWADE